MLAINWPFMHNQLWRTEEYGEFSGMISGKGNRSSQEKPAQVPLCQQQIPYDMTWFEPKSLQWVIHYHINIKYCYVMNTISFSFLMVTLLESLVRRRFP
jgi:hypothetical protein